MSMLLTLITGLEQRFAGISHPISPTESLIYDLSIYFDRAFAHKGVVMMS